MKRTGTWEMYIGNKLGGLKTAGWEIPLPEYLIHDIQHWYSDFLTMDSRRGQTGSEVSRCSMKPVENENDHRNGGRTRNKNKIIKAVTDDLGFNMKQCFGIFLHRK